MAVISTPHMVTPVNTRKKTLDVEKRNTGIQERNVVAVVREIVRVLSRNALRRARSGLSFFTRPYSSMSRTVELTDSPSTMIKAV